MSWCEVLVPHLTFRIFLVGDFPVFRKLGVDREPAAIAGADLFAGRDFVVDFKRQRLLVKSK